MAQVNIHPEIKEVIYRFSQGRSLKLRSTYKRNKEFLLETDLFSHPAWKEDAKAVDSSSTSVSKFNDTFGGVSLFSQAVKSTSSLKNMQEDKNIEASSKIDSIISSEIPTHSGSGIKKGNKSKK